MPDAGSPDKIIGIFLWLLLRMPDVELPEKIFVSGIFLWFLLRTQDAGLPADPIVFTESMSMFLYKDARCRFAR